ncbi:MAG: transposase [Gemmatimonadota bacterium]
MREHQREYGSQYAAIRSVAEKIGCHPESLRGWVRRSEVEDGVRPGVTTEEQARVAAWEREVKELRRANEILEKAAAFFAQAELDRRGP